MRLWILATPFFFTYMRQLKKVFIKIICLMRTQENSWYFFNVKFFLRWSSKWSTQISKEDIYCRRQHCNLPHNLPYPIVLTFPTGIWISPINLFAPLAASIPRDKAEVRKTSTVVITEVLELVFQPQSSCFEVTETRPSRTWPCPRSTEASMDFWWPDEGPIWRRELSEGCLKYWTNTTTLRTDLRWRLSCYLYLTMC